jgi:hypothetical protein
MPGLWRLCRCLPRGRSQENINYFFSKKLWLLKGSQSFLFSQNGFMYTLLIVWINKATGSQFEEIPLDYFLDWIGCEVDTSFVFSQPWDRPG